LLDTMPAADAGGTTVVVADEQFRRTYRVVRR
jgi:hypothetical protein